IASDVSVLRSNLANEAKFGINRFAGRLGELDPRSPLPMPQTTITGVNVVPGLSAETSQRNTSFEYIDRGSEWQEVGNRREAFYADLSPGPYRFRVAASNNSGVWNETDASLAFSITPANYQT